MSYLKRISTRRPPQSAPIRGAGQVANSAGGYAWAVDDWTRLRRFLVLGSEGGSYYAAERTLTRENAHAVERCLAADGPRTVAEIVRVSHEGRAPKNDPALFALAMAAGLGDEATRQAALDALPRVAARARTCSSSRRSSRASAAGAARSAGRSAAGTRRGRPDALAYQAVKYRQREGVTHRDLLRLAHPAGGSARATRRSTCRPSTRRLFEWIVRGGDDGRPPARGRGLRRARRRRDGPARGGGARPRVRPAARGASRAEHLTSREVWEALLEDMPMTALIRNLATMTRVGVLAPRLGRHGEGGRPARRRGAHPPRAGAPDRRCSPRCARTRRAAARAAATRGSPVREVVDALDAAFYTAFGNVEPTGKRLLLALDVSGSMTWGEVAGVPGLTPRDASAALALVTAATEARYEIVGFFAGKGGFTAARPPAARRPARTA